MPPSKAAPARKPAAERAPKKANEKSNDECSHQKVPVRRRRRNSNPKKEIIGPQKTSSKVARKPTKATVGPSTPKLQQVRNTSTTSFTIKVKPLFSVQKQNAAIWHSKSSKTDLALFSPTDADDEVEERQKQQRFEQTAGCQSSKAKRRDSDLLPTVDVAADYISSDSPRWFSSLTAAPETSSPLRCRVDTGFQWDADAVSERTILENLETLNSLIVNLVTPLVECVADRRYKDFNRSPELTLNALEVLADHATTFGSVEQICAYLIQNDGINNKKRSLLEECILLDRICSLLYEEFFEGDYFFGLFPGDSRVILNSLFGRIAKDQPWPIALRWRSITAASGRSAEASRSKTTKMIQAIKAVFKICHPFKTTRFANKFDDTLNSDEMSRLVLSIVETAHQLSLSLQKDVVSALVRVTIAPQRRKDSSIPRKYWKADHRLCQSAWSSLKLDDGDQVLGTCRLGLERIDEYTEQGTSLILPRVVTDKIFTLST